MNRSISFLLALSLITACGDRTQRQSPSTAQQTTSTVSQASVHGAIPKDVSYEILRASRIPKIKCSLDIRLNRKVSEDVLRAIAMKLRSQEGEGYERMFIAYYLPSMEVGSGAWATSHFNPTLKIEILGLATEQEKSLMNEPNDPSRRVIGKWLDNRPFAGGIIIIYQKNGTLMIERKFKDGSNLSEELIERAKSRARTFEKKRDRRDAEYYVIDQGGNLQIRDHVLGLIATAESIR